MAKRNTTPAAEPEESRDGPEIYDTEMPVATLAAIPPEPPGITERIERLEARAAAMAAYIRQLSGQEF